MITVVRNPKESPERLIGRFNKKVQQSRIVLAVRATRYHTKKPTGRLIRNAALMREQYRATRAKSKFK